MKQLIAALFLLSAVPAVQAAHDQGHVCQIGTEQDFYQGVAAAKKATLMVASNAARDAIMAKVNDDRLKNNLFLVEVEKLVIGIFSENGQMYVGVVGFKDRCVVPGTIAVVSAQDWVSFTVSIGVSADDFSKVVDG